MRRFFTAILTVILCSRKAGSVDNDFDIRVYIEIVRRRFLVLFVPFIFVFFSVVAIALYLPSIYRATAVVLVESPQISHDLVQSTVPSSAQQQLHVLRQRVMTRDRLILLARQFNIDGIADGEISETKSVERMRRATRIEPIANRTKTHRGTDVVSFHVSFENENAEIASKVANRLVESILELNIRARTGRAEQTARFFERQLERLQNALSDVEERIAAFKRENSTALPAGLEHRQAQRAQLEKDVVAINQRLLMIHDELSMAQNGYGRSGSVIDRQTIEQQVLELEATLIELGGLYTDQHPQIQSVKSQLAALNDRYSWLSTVGETTIASGETGANAGSSLTAGMYSTAASIETERSVVRLKREQEALIKTRAASLLEIDQLTTSITQTPSIELALNKMQREQGVLETQLASAKAKLLAAATGERIEEDGQGERFEVIENAPVPEEPLKPNRRKIIFFGALLAAAVGGLLVVFMEMLDETIRTRSDLEKQLSVRPLAVVPLIQTRADKSRFNQLVRGGLSAGGATLCAALFTVHVMYAPLPMILKKIVERLA